MATSQINSSKKKERQPAYNPDVVVDYYKTFDIILVPEYKFSPQRDFRFDFANVKTKVALEVQGAIWKGNFGGHTSGKGYVRDMEKYNLAQALGWRIIQCVPQDVCMKDTAEIFKQTMEVTTQMSFTLPTLTPQEAVFLAGGAVLMLQKGVRSEGGEPDRFTQLMGLSLLNRLNDQQFDDPEIQEVLRAAVDAGMSITGEEVICFENLDGVQKTDAKKFM